MFNRLTLIGLLALLVGCNASKNQTNIELFDEMMDQISVKAQDWDPDKPDMRANMVPPEHSVPRGFTPYKYELDAATAQAKLVNPLANDFGPKVIELGKKNFDIYCKVCHGAEGKGDGLVAAKMILRPPSVISQKIRDMKDGGIFHIITAGQGLMGNYATQITDEKARWAVVNYVRTLQRQSNQM